MAIILRLDRVMADRKISPGWQSSSLHMAFRVEKRIARTFPVFRLERLTLEMPTRSAV